MLCSTEQIAVPFGHPSGAHRDTQEVLVSLEFHPTPRISPKDDRPPRYASVKLSKLLFRKLCDPDPARLNHTELKVQ